MGDRQAGRVNLYDDDHNLWGCYYPHTRTLVKRERRTLIEMDLTPFLPDKTKTDGGQNEKFGL